MSPRLSVITALGDRPERLARTVNSLSGHGSGGVEHVLVGSAAADVDPPDDVEVRWVTSSASTRTDAVRAGLQAATGDVVAWLRPGERLVPGAVAAVVGAFDDDPRLELLHGDGYLLGPGGVRVSEVKGRVVDPCIWETMSLLPPTVFYRRAALLAAGGPDPRFDGLMEWELLLRLSRRRAIGHLPQHVAEALAGDVGNAPVRAVLRELGLVWHMHGHTPFASDYLLYVLDALEPGVRDGRRPLPRLTSVILRALAIEVHRHRNQWRRNNWVTWRLDLALVPDPGRGEVLRVSGWAPPRRASKPERELRVCWDGRLLPTKHKVIGDFDVAIHPPQGWNGSRARVSVRTSVFPLGFRRGVYFLDSVRWVRREPGHRRA